MNKVISLLLPALLMPLSAWAAETVTFTYQPVEGNQTLTAKQTENLGLKFDISVNDALMGHMSASKDKTESISLQLGKWTSKKKSAVMEFGDNVVKETQTTPDGKTQETSAPSPLAGQTFRFEWTNNMEQPTITRNDGGPVDPKKLPLLLEEWTDLPNQKPDEFAAALMGKTLEVGQVVDLTVDQLSGLMDMAGDEFSIAKPVIRFKEVRIINDIPCGIFGMDFKMTGQSAGMNMTMPLLGEVILGVNNLQMYTAQFEGPIQVEQSGVENGQKIHMIGTGKVSFNITHTYEK